MFGDSTSSSSHGRSGRLAWTTTRWNRPSTSTVMRATRRTGRREAVRSAANWLHGELSDAMHAVLCGAGHNLRMNLRYLRVLG